MIDDIEPVRYVLEIELYGTPTRRYTQIAHLVGYMHDQLGILLASEPREVP